MIEDLFRPEVIEAQQWQHFGISLNRNGRKFLILSLACVLTICAAISFICIVDVPRSIWISGAIQPTDGTVEIKSPSTSRVKELFVDEGRLVKAGTMLATLEASTYVKTGELREEVAGSLIARVRATEAELGASEQKFQTRERALQERKQNLEQEQQRIEEELEALKEKVRIAEQSLGRFEDLAAQGYFSEAQVLSKREELAEARARYHASSRNTVSIQREISSATTEMRLALLERDEKKFQLASSIQQLRAQESENSALRLQIIRAPVDGNVSSLTIHSGKNVEQGENLLTLLPATNKTFEVQLLVSSRDVGQLKVSEGVWLTFPAFPYQKFGRARGELVEIGMSPVILASNKAAAATDQGQWYRARVRLISTPHSIELRTGLSVNANIQLERRTIANWFLSSFF